MFQSNGAGMDAFTFDYRVQWPTSLVLSQKALTKYRLIFRHLFHIKNVQRKNNMWFHDWSVFCLFELDWTRLDWTECDMRWIALGWMRWVGGVNCNNNVSP